MSFWDNVKKFAQPYSDDEYEDEYDEELTDFEEEAAQESAPRGRRTSPFAAAAQSSSSDYSASNSSSSGGFNGQVLNMSSGKQEVVLFHAKTFDDAAKAADELRRRKAVILNMENVDKALTRRVVDFLSGSVYALDGRVKKVAQCTYLFCPHNMDVVGDLENIHSEAESYL
ncbi:MAG: cell division protein SepF [Oscillospiraceae bacterium]|nr:cell division protein SepF [Oscillospiraceae bacterium]